MVKWELGEDLLKIQRKFTETFRLCYNQGEVTLWKDKIVLSTNTERKNVSALKK